MATVSSDSSQPLAVGTWAVDAGTASKSERYLAKRLAAAGADYKGVAFATFLLAAAVVTLAWLAAGVLAEHWLVQGGLPRWARWVWLGAGLMALAAAIVRWVVPLVRYRVNLVYAARAIEREFPDLHNDLVNAVLVKLDGEGASQRMVRSLKRRAAKRLSKVAIDEAVIDRTEAIRLAGAVAALVAIACLYEVLAPKSLLTSAGRLLAPWATTAAPSRARISDVQLHWRIPGEDHGDGAETPKHAVQIQAATATIVRGRQLVVSAELRGLRRNEQPTLSIRPLSDKGGGQSGGTPWEAVMQRRGDGAGFRGAFVAVLPDASRGIDHSLEFTIAAGDARSEPLKVIAVDAASLLVREIRYDYPAYTRQAAEVVRWQGDIRAVEGTAVTIFAAGNRPIASGWIDFGCDGKRDRPLKLNVSDPAQGSASFDLKLDSDRAGPEHASYRLLFQPRDDSSDGAGGLWVGDLQHRIDVVPDVAPEVTIEDPTESPLKVPPDAPVRVRVRAVDPDYGLTRVGLEVRLKDGQPRPEIVLLSKEKSGPFTGSTLLVPRQLGALPGTTLEYRGVAVDTRPEQPNISRTQWHSLIIDPSAPSRQTEPNPPEKSAGNNQSQGQNQQGQNQQGQNQQGQNQQGQNQQGQNQQGQNQQGQNQQGQNQQGQNQQGQNQQGQNQQGQNQQGQNQQGQNQQGQNQQGQNQQGQNQQGQNQQGQNQQGQNQQGQNQQGQNQQGQNQQGQNQQGQNQQGQNQQGQNQQGQNQQGQNQQGQNQQGQNQQGQNQQGQNQQGQNQQGQNQQGQNQQGQNQQGQNQQGQNQQGQNQQGQRSESANQQAAQDTVAADGTNDGEAMERILEHRRKQEGGQPSEPGQTGQDGDKAGGDKAGGDKAGGDKAGGDKAGGDKAGGDKAGGDKAGGDKAGGDKAGGDKAGGDKAGGDKAGGDKAGGDKAGELPDGEPSAGKTDGEGGRPSAGNASAPDVGQSEGGGAEAKEKPQAGGAAGTQGGDPGTGGREGGEGAPRTDRPALGGEQERRELEWGDENLRHARNAADLAVEHLRNSLDAGRDEVLDALGWTPEQARAFIDRWQALRRLAEDDDPRQRGEFERAVRSLGLRPGGVRSSRDVPTDMKGGQAEGRRSRPPSEYREQVRAYLQGTSGE